MGHETQYGPPPLTTLPGECATQVVRFLVDPPSGGKICLVSTFSFSCQEVIFAD